MTARSTTRSTARSTPTFPRCATHHGIAPLGVVLRCGFSKSTVYRMVREGELELLMPSVFKGAQWPTGREQLMAAACMRNPHVAIGFTTAAQLWSFRALPKDLNIHLLVPHWCSVDLVQASESYIVHRCRRIDPVDIVERDDGIRLVSPTRALFDIADTVLDMVCGSILEQLINDGRGGIGTHIATLTRLGHPHRPGTATLGRVIGSRPRMRTAMQSDLEARVLAEIERQGLPRPEVQFPLTLPDQRRIRLDFAWPQFREALEVDHPFWHAGYNESDRDKRRDRKAATIGWHTTRLTDFDVDGGLGEAIHDVATILAFAMHRA